MMTTSWVLRSAMAVLCEKVSSLGGLDGAERFTRPGELSRRDARLRLPFDGLRRGAGPDDRDRRQNGGKRERDTELVDHPLRAPRVGRQRREERLDEQVVRPVQDGGRPEAARPQAGPGVDEAR